MKNVLQRPRYVLYFRVVFFLSLTTVVFCWSAATAGADSGTWTANANATWSTASSWQDGIIADGAGNTATFDRSGFAGTRTITLDFARTIGSVNYTGTPTQSRNIIIAGTETLTLDNGNAASVISNHGWGSATSNISNILLNSDLELMNAPVDGTGQPLSGYVTLNSVVGSSGGLRTITTLPSPSATDAPSDPNFWRIVLGGAAGRIEDGSGQIAIRHASGNNLNLQTSANTFTGGLYIKTGAVRVSQLGNSALGGSGNIITFEARDTSDADAVLEFHGVTNEADATVDKAAVLAASGVISINLDVARTIDWTGVISGTGSLTKAGDGELRLSGQNTYAGNTIIASGTLSLGRAAAISNQSVLVLSGGVFSAAGYSQSFGGLTLTENATISLGDADAANALAFGSNLNMGAYSLAFEGAGQTTIRFGTDGTALTAEEISRITINGLPVALDQSGYLAIATAPNITTHPTDTTVISGDDAIFRIVADGNPAPAYQWQSSPDGGTWSDIPGETFITLTLTAVTTDISGTQYRCIVTNSQGSETSRAAILTVNINPALVAAQQMKTELEAPGSAIVTVDGAIDLTLVGGATVTSPKTIFGADANATIKGDLIFATSTGETIILGVNFNDGVFILDGVNDVSISHCTFTDTPVSIIGGSDNITFSWNKFYSTIAGAGMAMTISDAGGVQLNHNLWDASLRDAMPAATNARVLMFNNYLFSTLSDNTTATTAGAEAQILSIRNIYQKIHNPIVKESTGLLRALDNFNTETTGTLADGDDKIFVPDYSFTVFDAAEEPPLDATTVMNLITASAGNTAGKDSVTPAITDGSGHITVTGISTGGTSDETSATILAGGTFTLTANATGFIPTAYQWYCDNFAIPGATSFTYAVTNASADDHAGSYSVAQSLSEGGIVFSKGFTVTVNPEEPAAPVITSHPASQSVTVGDNATFAVVATGDGLSYQWMKNGEDISDATLSNYTITNVQQSHAGDYSVRVSNSVGSVTSNTASLVVNSVSGGGGGGGAPSFLGLCSLVLLVVFRAVTRRMTK